MKQRGRTSLAALSVVGESSAAAIALMPPPGLTPAEKGVWLQTVNSKPTDWFGSENVPVLVEYVRQVCRGHVLADQIKDFDAAWLATDDGLKRYERLQGLSLKTAGMIQKLATTMRLTQQSIYRADKIGLQKTKSKLWQREPS